MVLLRSDVDPSDFRAVMREIWQRFDPEDHMWVLPFMPLDTLDFTSFKMHVGSKLVIDAAGDTLGSATARDIDPRRFDARVSAYRLLDGGMLVVVVQGSARE